MNAEVDKPRALQTAQTTQSGTITHKIKILKKPSPPFTGKEAPFMPRCASVGAVARSTPSTLKVNPASKSLHNLTRDSVFEMVNNLIKGDQENKVGSTSNKIETKAAGALNVQTVSPPCPINKQMTGTFISNEPNSIPQLTHKDHNYTFVPSRVGQSTCITMFAEKPASKNDLSEPCDNTPSIHTLASTIMTPKHSMYPACSPASDYKLVQVPPAIQAQLEIQAGMKPSFNAKDLEEQSNMRVANAVNRSKFPSAQTYINSRPIHGRTSEPDSQCEPIDYSLKGMDKHEDRSPPGKNQTSDCQRNILIQKVPSPISHVPQIPHGHTMDQLGKGFPTVSHNHIMVHPGKSWEDFQRENIASQIYTSMWQQMCSRENNSSTQNIAQISSILKEDIRGVSSPESGSTSPDSDLNSEHVESPESNQQNSEQTRENPADQSTPPRGSSNAGPTSDIVGGNSNDGRSKDLYRRVPIQPHHRELPQPKELPTRPVRGTPKKLVQCMTMPRRQPEYLNRSLVLNLAENILENDYIQREENESRKIFLRMLLQTILNTVISAQTAHRTLRCISIGGVNIEVGTLAFIKSQLEALIHTTVATVNSLSIKMNNDLLMERKSATGHVQQHAGMSGNGNRGNIAGNNAQTSRSANRNQKASGDGQASFEIKRQASDSRLLAQVGEALNNGVLTDNKTGTRPAQTLITQPGQPLITQKHINLPAQTVTANNLKKTQKNGEFKSSQNNTDTQEKEIVSSKENNSSGDPLDSRMFALSGTALDNMTHTPLDSNRYWKKRMLNKTSTGNPQQSKETSQTHSHDKKNKKNLKSKRKRNSKGSPNGSSPPVQQDKKKSKATVVLMDCMNNKGV